MQIGNKYFDRVSVISSMLVSIGYEQETETLQIEFKDGTIFNYEKVPFDVYTNMMDSASIGSFYHKNIKSKYLSTKL